MKDADLPIAVIGSGLAGLASAVTLAGRGHRVLLLEANEWLGGKAAVLESDGFRFDMGPTILTLPRVLERVLSEAGRKLADELDLVKLDPQWRCFFDDGDVLDLVGDVDEMVANLDRFTDDGDAGRGYRRYLAQSKRLHEISERFFFWKSVEGIRDTLDVRANMKLSTVSDVLALRMGQTLGGVVRRHLRDERVAQMVDHFVQYVGSNPFAAPAVLGGIADMQTTEGIWYPRGGIGRVPAALARVARACGVEVRTGASVAGIGTTGGRVSSVRLANGEEIAVKAVVSNMDAARTYRELVPPAWRTELEPSPARRREPACSGVVLYLGLDRAYEHLAHHSFVFSRDADEEFDHIYRRGEPAPDPTCYLAAPARTDPGVAPPGGEGAVRAGPHAVPAAASRLGRDAAGVSQGDPRQARALGGPARPRVAHPLRTTPDAGRHPLAVPRAERRDLRAREPRPLRRRVQARQSSFTAAGPVSRRWRGASRSRHADGADVRLDRRRHARPGPRRRRGCRRMSRSATDDADDPERLRSPLHVRFFTAAIRRRMRQGFAGVRLSRRSMPLRAEHFDGRPLVVYSNHPSWWDPVLLALLIDRTFPDRRTFAPIDADALRRYRFMRRCGLFGLEPGTQAGAARLLAVGRRVLAAPDALLCITPQGRFGDVRERPLALRRGLAALLARTPGVTAIPVALDYPFWDESRPEALARWGEPLAAPPGPRWNASAWHGALTGALSDTMDALTGDAIERDPTAWVSLVEGTTGVGGLYDGWRRLGSWMAGRRFDPSHAQVGRKSVE